MQVVNSRSIAQVPADGVERPSSTLPVSSGRVPEKGLNPGEGSGLVVLADLFPGSRSLIQVVSGATFRNCTRA